MLRTRILVATLALAAGLVPAARAGLIPNKVTVTPEDGNHRWTYQVVVTSDLYVSTGDYFTIYDFGGGIAGKEQYDSNLWTMTVAPSTPVPAEYGQLSPNDNPNVENYTFTYTGQTTIVGSALIGDFSLLSPFDIRTDSVFTSVNHRIDNTVVGPDPREFNLTPTVVAVATNPPDDPPTVEEPEPATLVLAGAALPVLLARRFRRNKK